VQVWLRTQVGGCKLGFSYALAPESTEGLTKETIHPAATKSPSALTITRPCKPRPLITRGRPGAWPITVRRHETFATLTRGSRLTMGGWRSELGVSMEATTKKGQRTWRMLVLVLVALSPWSAQAQERSVFSSQTQEKLGPLSEVVAAVSIPAEWGTLRNVLPLAGDPPYYTLFFEDVGGAIRIVPLYLTLGAGTWQLSLRRDPVVVIKRGP
jgi:hypothetical protein